MNWEEKTLGDFISMKRGYDLPNQNRMPGNIPVMGSAGQNGFHNKAKVKGLGVVIGRSGNSYGEIHLSKVDFWAHNTAMYVNDFKGNVPLFAYYFLKNLDFKNFNSGSAQPSLNRNFIYPIRVTIPPLPTQRRIASILTAYDDLIENNLRRIRLLEEVAQRTFEEWFVRFRVGGQPLEIEEGTGLPRGWERMNLNSFFSIKYGKNLSTTKIGEKGRFPVYGASGKMGYFDECNVNKKVALITSRGNGSGDVHRTFENEVFVTNNSFMVLPKEGFEHIPFFMAMEFLKGLNLKSFCSGSAQPQLTNSALNQTEIVVPKKDLIESYSKKCTPFFELVDLLLVQNAHLKTARDLLLPRLMTGEIEVGEEATEK